MNKIINVSSGAELFKIFNGVSKVNLSGKTLNISHKAAAEYSRICEAAEQYGRSLVRESFPQHKQLVSANSQICDMIESTEAKGFSSLISNAISEAKKSGKPFEFVCDNVRYIAEIIDGEPKIRFLDVIKK